MENSGDGLTHDRFLDGALEIWQPRAGFRAGVDAVFLGAAIDAKPGQNVLELGCGVGVASLCLACRVSGLVLTGVEIQSDYADLARRNASENSVEMDVAEADICDLPLAIRNQIFDHVFANPPYYQRSHGSASENVGRDLALAGNTPLLDWVDVATRRLRPGGHLTFIQKASRLPDMLRAMDSRLGSVKVKPLAARVGRESELVIVTARKGGRAAFKLLAPLILHEGTRHVRDGESYTRIVRNILRTGAPLEIC
ncbi:MAG: methyltransferase [Marinosulfonomonas sp.]|nr:MAG: methyltransferase [Marinosulfonomonas sp.]